MNFLAIEWDPSLGIDLGFFVVRWYSLMFVAAFLLGLHLMKKIYIKDEIPAEKLDVLFMYVFVSMLIGMRLGCLLYTSDAADDMQCVDLGGRRIIKKR